MSTPLEGENDIVNPVSHAKAGELYSEREISYTYEAEVRTLQSIFEDSAAPKVIDLLSLDVEGGELEVLRGIVFTHTNFHFILVESRSFEKLNKFLIHKNYRLISQLTHHDFLFIWNQSNLLSVEVSEFLTS